MLKFVHTDTQDLGSLYFQFICLVQHVQFLPHTLRDKDKVLRLVAAIPITAKYSVVGFGNGVCWFGVTSMDSKVKSMFMLIMV